MKQVSFVVIIILLSNAFAPLVPPAITPVNAGPAASGGSRDIAGPFGPADLVKLFDSGAIDGNLGPEVVVDDLDGDGDLDMLFYYDMGGSGGFFVHSAIDLKDNKTLWASNWTADSPRNWTKVVDLEGDGKKELLWVTNTNVYVVHANNGTLSWTAETGDVGGCTYGDIDGDKRMEVIVSTSGNNVQYIARNGTTGAVKYRIGLIMKAHDPKVGDDDGDGRGELVVMTNLLPNYGVTVVDMYTNTTEWTKSYTVPISVQVADFNGTGKQGVLVRDSNTPGGWLSPAPTNLTMFWKGGVQVWKKGDYVSMAYIKQLANTDGDSDLEVLSSDHTRKDVELIDAGNGTSQGYYLCATYPPVWSAPLDEGDSAGSDIVSMGHGMGDYGLALLNGTDLGFKHRFNFSSASIALKDDVDGDLQQELVIRPQSDSVHVYNYTSYGLEWENSTLGSSTILTDGWLMGWFNGSNPVLDVVTTSDLSGNGASIDFFSGSNGTVTESTSLYFTPRLIVKDFNGDGLDELILMTNDITNAQSRVYLLKADFPPRLKGPIPTITLQEDGNVTHAVDIAKNFFDDGMNGPLTYAVVNSPGKAAVLGALDGTWLNVKTNITNWNGNTILNVTASDGKHQPTVMHIPVVVLPVNDVPIIQSVGDLSFMEHTRVLFKVNATDVDDPVLSFTDNTSLFDIDSMTGQVDFIAVESMVGAWAVNVTVTDSVGAMVWVHFTVTIIDVNDPPVISTIDVITATEGKEYKVKYNATDSDKVDTTLTWALKTLGKWLAIDPATGVLNGTPGEADVGHGFVNVTVTDPRGGKAFHNFTLNVVNINEAPVWKDVPRDSKIMDTDTFRFDVNATDTDLADKLTYGVKVSPTASPIIDPATGVLTWKPADGTSGNFTFNLSVTDGTWVIHHAFKIQVTHIIVPVDQPPTASLKAPADGSEIDVLNPILQWTTYDAEGEVVTVDLYLGTQRNLVLANDASTRTASSLTGTSFKLITPLEAGQTYFWTIVPKDPSATGTCPSGVWAFKIKTGATVNQPPSITPITTKQEATVGQTFKLQVQGSDPDPGDATKLSYSVSGQPQGMTIDPSKGLIYWVPTDANVGNYTVKVSLTDGKETVNTTFQLEVKKTPVTPPPKPHDDNGLSGLMIGIIVAVIAAVIAVIGIAVWSRNRKKEPTFPVKPVAETTKAETKKQETAPPPPEPKKEDAPKPKEEEPPMAKEPEPSKPVTEPKPKPWEKRREEVPPPKGPDAAAKQEADEIDKILAGIDDEPRPPAKPEPKEPELSRTIERPFDDDGSGKVH